MRMNLFFQLDPRFIPPVYSFPDKITDLLEQNHQNSFQRVFVQNH